MAIFNSFLLVYQRVFFGGGLSQWLVFPVGELRPSPPTFRRDARTSDSGISFPLANTSPFKDKLVSFAFTINTGSGKFEGTIFFGGFKPSNMLFAGEDQ